MADVRDSERFELYRPDLSAVAPDFRAALRKLLEREETLGLHAPVIWHIRDSRHGIVYSVTKAEAEQLLALPESVGIGLMFPAHQTLRLVPDSEGDPAS